MKILKFLGIQPLSDWPKNAKSNVIGWNLKTLIRKDDWPLVGNWTNTLIDKIEPIERQKDTKVVYQQVCGQISKHVTILNVFLSSSKEIIKLSSQNQLSTF